METRIILYGARLALDDTYLSTLGCFIIVIRFYRKVNFLFNNVPNCIKCDSKLYLSVYINCLLCQVTS